MHTLPPQPDLLTEAVRLAEARGPLDDAQALRQAADAYPAVESRIAERAHLLSERVGLASTWRRARSLAPWLLLGIAAVVACAGWVLAGGVTGERHINVVVALASLLGMHLFTLVLWAGSLLMPRKSLPASFGSLWFFLGARFAGGRDGEGALLVRAATGLLIRARLLPWALGLVSHAVWSLSFLVVTAALLFSLAFRSYTLGWESTILEPGFFLRTVQGLGWLPSMLGFPVPDAQAVLAPAVSGTAAGAPTAIGNQRDWALWLTGCLVCYGLLPRLVLTALCAAACRARRSRLAPDLRLPYFRKLAHRFEALAPIDVVDAQSHEAWLSGTGSPTQGHASTPGQGQFAIAYEWPPEWPWPPAAAVADAEPQHRQVDGSAASVAALVDELRRHRAERLVIEVNPLASPDRGTERFLRELRPLGHRCELRLAEPPGSPPAAEEAHARWHRWLERAGLQDWAPPPAGHARNSRPEPTATDA